MFLCICSLICSYTFYLAGTVTLATACWAFMSEIAGLLEERREMLTRSFTTTTRNLGIVLLGLARRFALEQFCSLYLWLLDCLRMWSFSFIFFSRWEAAENRSLFACVTWRQSCDDPRPRPQKIFVIASVHSRRTRGSAAVATFVTFKLLVFLRVKILKKWTTRADWRLDRRVLIGHEARVAMQPLNHHPHSFQSLPSCFLQPSLMSGH